MAGERSHSQSGWRPAAFPHARATLTHGLTTTSFPAKRRLRKNAKNSILISVTTQIWVVFPTGRTTTSTNQKHNPDASSVSNFFARSSDRSFRGESSGVTANCHIKCNSLYHSFNSFISLLHIAFYYLYNIFHRSKLNALYKTQKRTIRLNITKQNLSAFK